MQKETKKLLQFIHGRLLNVHNENPNVDYMLKLKELTVNPVNDPAVAAELQIRSKI